MRLLSLFLTFAAVNGYGQHSYRADIGFAQITCNTAPNQLVGKQLYFASVNGRQPAAFTTITTDYDMRISGLPYYDVDKYPPAIHGCTRKGRTGNYYYTANLYKAAITSPPWERTDITVGTPYSAVVDRLFTITGFKDSTAKSSGTCWLVFTLQDDRNQTLRWTLPQDEVANLPMVHIGYHQSQKHMEAGRKYYMRDGAFPKFSFNMLDGRNYENVPGREYTCINTNFTKRTALGPEGPFVILRDDNGYDVAICYPGNEKRANWGCTSYYYNEDDYAWYKVWQRLAADSTANARITQQREQEEGERSLRQHEQDLSKRYGKEIANLIMAGKVKLGMTKAACLEAWDEPDMITETQQKNGKTETWRYSHGRRLKFTNGRLTSFTDLN